MAMGGNLLKIGEKTIVGDLFIQLIFFGVCVLVASIFHHRMLSTPTIKVQNPEIRWKKYLTTLYITSALILVRSIFRVIEYVQGNHGVLLRTEVYLYVFESVLMFFVMAWMNWYHPSEIGLLIREEKPSSNGLELLKIGRKSK